jgi:hypothetical protein
MCLHIRRRKFLPIVIQGKLYLFISLFMRVYFDCPLQRQTQRELCFPNSRATLPHYIVNAALTQFEQKQVLKLLWLCSVFIHYYTEDDSLRGGTKLVTTNHTIICWWKWNLLSTYFSIHRDICVTQGVEINFSSPEDTGQCLRMVQHFRR